MMFWPRLLQAAGVGGLVTFTALAHADDRDRDGLPCNSLCQRWMAFGSDAGPVPPADIPVARAPAGSSPVALHPEIEARPFEPVASKPVRLPADHGAKRAEQKAGLADSQPRVPVPLPPRLARPRATALAKEPAANRVERIMALLPAPPPVPRLEPSDMAGPGIAAAGPHPLAAPVPAFTAPLASAEASAETALASKQEQAHPAASSLVASIAPPASPAADAAPFPAAASSVPASKLRVAMGPPVEPAQAGTPPSPSAIPDRTASAGAGWPPPIDVIGALLMNPPHVRSQTP